MHVRSYIWYINSRPYLYTYPHSEHSSRASCMFLWDWVTRACVCTCAYKSSTSEHCIAVLNRATNVCVCVWVRACFCARNIAMTLYTRPDLTVVFQRGNAVGRRTPVTRRWSWRRSSISTGT